MKRVVKVLPLLAVMLFIGLGLQSFVKEHRSIVGKWSGSAKGKTGTMVFSKDGYLTLTIDGETMGGKNFKTESGEIVNMVYTADYTKNPCWIDVTLKNNKGQKMQGSKGIFEFVNDNSIKVRISFDGSDTRPKTFNDKGTAGDETFVLTRAK